MTRHIFPNSILGLVARAASVAAAMAGAVMLATFLAAPTAYPQSASDTGAAQPSGASASSGTPQTPSSKDKRLQVFLQRRFRLPNASDVQLGPPKRSDVPGLVMRTVTMHNEQGQSATFVVYTDPAAAKTAIVSNVVIGPASPGPAAGLWSRPLRAPNAPASSPPTSELITTSPGKAILGTVLDLTKDPWGRISLGKLKLDDRATAGPADAPVTIVEFADLECPYCARAFSDVETLVNNSYKGKVRVIFKNFPLNIHPWAMQAAIAAECVRRQNPDDFWPFAGDVYRDQGQITPQNLRDHVLGYARKLGLDDKALQACMVGSSAEKQVEEDAHEGEMVGVNSTPTFFINGIEFVGLPSDKTFSTTIDSELKQREARR
jgi:protein-disulfide isomerase